MIYGVISLSILILTIAALVDIITRMDGTTRHLPKMVWIMLVIFLPLVGSIIWFALGHSRGAPEGNGGGRYAEPFHRGDVEQQKSQAADTRVRSTEQELEDLDREIELHERHARLRKLRGEAGDGL